MFVLALAICAAGVAAALLPPMPLGTSYWVILLVVSLLYPLILARTFRRNRADYEFRLLHWFPAAIFIVWFVFQYIGPTFNLFRILALGLFFLWSLPLVVLGLTFIMLFALHVLRRSHLRVSVLSVMLGVFIVGALGAEASGINERLQAAIFPKDARIVDTVRMALESVRASFFSRGGSSSGVLVAVGTSSSMVQDSSRSAIAISSSSQSSASSVSTQSSRSLMASSVPIFSSSVAPVIDRKPEQLPKSGPESVAVLGATVLAAYAGLLHARARKRA